MSHWAAFKLRKIALNAALTSLHSFCGEFSILNQMKFETDNSKAEIALVRTN